MRNLFLFLLAANVCYLDWNYLQPKAVQSTPRLATPGVPPLMLLSEDDDEAAGGKPGPDAQGRSCYTLGPFKEQATATRIADAIKGKGLPVEERSRDERQEVGIWVYLPPLGSREEALEVSKTLAARGVSDYFVVSADDNKNAISLGLFTQRDGAERRRQQIADLGYAPQAEARYREITYFWLDYREPADNTVPENTWQSIAGDEAVQRFPRVCG